MPKKREIPLWIDTMDDSDFMTFQDDFYNLLEKYGVADNQAINCEHKKWNKICSLRNKVCEFIEKENWKNKQKEREIKNDK